MSTVNRLAMVAVVLLLCVGCDQATKSMAQAVLSETAVSSLLGGSVRLQLTHNEGAFLGLGASLPEVWRRVLLGGGVGILLLAVLAYTLFSKQSGPFTVLALALIFAGGVSNSMDRLAHDGRVIDFINIGIGPVRTGIFNVADVSISTGVLVLLAIGLIRSKRASRVESHR